MPKPGATMGNKKKKKVGGGVKIVGSKIVRSDSLEIVEVDMEDDAMSQVSNATYTVEHPVTPMIGEFTTSSVIDFGNDNVTYGSGPSGETHQQDFTQAFLDNEKHLAKTPASKSDRDIVTRTGGDSMFSHENVASTSSQQILKSSQKIESSSDSKTFESNVTDIQTKHDILQKQKSRLSDELKNIKDKYESRHSMDNQKDSNKTTDNTSVRIVGGKIVKSNQNVQSSSSKMQSSSSTHTSKSSSDQTQSVISSEDQFSSDSNTLSSDPVPLKFDDATKHVNIDKKRDTQIMSTVDNTSSLSSDKKHEVTVKMVASKTSKASSQQSLSKSEQKMTRTQKAQKTITRQILDQNGKVIETVTEVVDIPETSDTQISSSESKKSSSEVSHSGDLRIESTERQTIDSQDSSSRALVDTGDSSEIARSNYSVVRGGSTNYEQTSTHTESNMKSTQQHVSTSSSSDINTRTHSSSDSKLVSDDTKYSTSSVPITDTSDFINSEKSSTHNLSSFTSDTRNITDSGIDVKSSTAQKYDYSVTKDGHDPDLQSNIVKSKPSQTHVVSETPYGYPSAQSTPKPKTRITDEYSDTQQLTNVGGKTINSGNSHETTASAEITYGKNVEKSANTKSGTIKSQKIITREVFDSNGKLIKTYTEVIDLPDSIETYISEPESYISESTSSSQRVATFSETRDTRTEETQKASHGTTNVRMIGGKIVKSDVHSDQPAGVGSVHDTVSNVTDDSRRSEKTEKQMTEVRIIGGKIVKSAGDHVTYVTDRRDETKENIGDKLLGDDGAIYYTTTTKSSHYPSPTTTVHKASDTFESDSTTHRTNVDKYDATSSTTSIVKDSKSSEIVEKSMKTENTKSKSADGHESTVRIIGGKVMKTFGKLWGKSDKKHASKEHDDKTEKVSKTKTKTDVTEETSDFITRESSTRNQELERTDLDEANDELTSTTRGIIGSQPDEFRKRPGYLPTQPTDVSETDVHHQISNDRRIADSKDTDYITTERKVQQVKMIGGKLVKVETTEYIKIPKTVHSNEQTKPNDTSTDTKVSFADRSSLQNLSNDKSKAQKYTDEVHHTRIVGGKVIREDFKHDQPAGMSSVRDKPGGDYSSQPRDNASTVTYTRGQIDNVNQESQEQHSSSSEFISTQKTTEQRRMIGGKVVREETIHREPAGIKTSDNFKPDSTPGKPSLSTKPKLPKESSINVDEAVTHRTRIVGGKVIREEIKHDKPAGVSTVSDGKPQTQPRERSQTAGTEQSVDEFITHHTRIIGGKVIREDVRHDKPAGVSSVPDTHDRSPSSSRGKDQISKERYVETDTQESSERHSPSSDFIMTQQTTHHGRMVGGKVIREEIIHKEPAGKRTVEESKTDGAKGKLSGSSKPKLPRESGIDVDEATTHRTRIVGGKVIREDIHHDNAAGVSSVTDKHDRDSPSKLGAESTIGRQPVDSLTKESSERSPSSSDFIMKEPTSHHGRMVGGKVIREDIIHKEPAGKKTVDDSKPDNAKSMPSESSKTKPPREADIGVEEKTTHRTRIVGGRVIREEIQHDKAAGVSSVTGKQGSDSPSKLGDESTNGRQPVDSLTKELSERSSSSSDFITIEQTSHHGRMVGGKVIREDITHKEPAGKKTVEDSKPDTVKGKPSDSSKTKPTRESGIGVEDTTHRTRIVGGKVVREEMKHDKAAGVSSLTDKHGRDSPSKLEYDNTKGRNPVDSFTKESSERYSSSNDFITTEQTTQHGRMVGGKVIREEIINKEPAGKKTVEDSKPDKIKGKPSESSKPKHPDESGIDVDERTTHRTRIVGGKVIREEINYDKPAGVTRVSDGKPQTKPRDESDRPMEQSKTTRAEQSVEQTTSHHTRIIGGKVIREDVHHDKPAGVSSVQDKDDRSPSKLEDYPNSPRDREGILKERPVDNYTKESSERHSSSSDFITTEQTTFHGRMVGGKVIREEIINKEPAGKKTVEDSKPDKIKGKPSGSSKPKHPDESGIDVDETTTHRTRIVGGKVIREEIKRDKPAGVTRVSDGKPQSKPRDESDRPMEQSKTTRAEQSVEQTTSHHTRIIGGKVIREDVHHDKPAGVSSVQDKDDRSPSKPEDYPSSPRDREGILKERPADNYSKESSERHSSSNDFITTEQSTFHGRMVGGKVIREEIINKEPAGKKTVEDSKPDKIEGKPSESSKPKHRDESGIDVDETTTHTTRIVGGKVIREEIKRDKPAGVTRLSDGKPQSKPRDESDRPMEQSKTKRAEQLVEQTTTHHTRIIGGKVIREDVHHDKPAGVSSVQDKNDRSPSKPEDYPSSPRDREGSLKERPVDNYTKESSGRHSSSSDFITTEQTTFHGRMVGGKVIREEIINKEPAGKKTVEDSKPDKIKGKPSESSKPKHPDESGIDVDERTTHRTRIVGGKVIREEINYDKPAGVTRVSDGKPQTKPRDESDKPMEQSKTTRAEQSVEQTTSHHTRIIGGKVIREDVHHDKPAGVSSVQDKDDRSPSKPEDYPNSPRDREGILKERPVDNYTKESSERHSSSSDFITTEQTTFHGRMVGGKVIREEIINKEPAGKKTVEDSKPDKIQGIPSESSKPKHPEESGIDVEETTTHRTRIVGGKVIREDIKHDKPAGVTRVSDGKPQTKPRDESDRPMEQSKTTGAEQSVEQTTSHHTRIIGGKVIREDVHHDKPAGVSSVPVEHDRSPSKPDDQQDKSRISKERPVDTYIKDSTEKYSSSTDFITTEQTMQQVRMIGGKVIREEIRHKEPAGIKTDDDTMTDSSRGKPTDTKGVPGDQSEPGKPEKKPKPDLEGISTQRTRIVAGKVITEEIKHDHPAGVRKIVEPIDRKTPIKPTDGKDTPAGKPKTERDSVETTTQRTRIVAGKVIREEIKFDQPAGVKTVNDIKKPDGTKVPTDRSEPKRPKDTPEKPGQKPATVDRADDNVNHRTIIVAGKVIREEIKHDQPAGINTVREKPEQTTPKKPLDGQGNAESPERTITGKPQTQPRNPGDEDKPRDDLRMVGGKIIQPKLRHDLPAGKTTIEKQKDSVTTNVTRVEKTVDLNDSRSLNTRIVGGKIIREELKHDKPAGFSSVRDDGNQQTYLREPIDRSTKPRAKQDKPTEPTDNTSKEKSDTKPRDSTRAPEKPKKPKDETDDVRFTTERSSTSKKFIDSESRSEHFNVIDGRLVKSTSPKEPSESRKKPDDTEHFTIIDGRLVKTTGPNEPSEPREKPDDKKTPKKGPSDQPWKPSQERSPDDDLIPTGKPYEPATELVEDIGSGTEKFSSTSSTRIQSSTSQVKSSTTQVKSSTTQHVKIVGGKIVKTIQEYSTGPEPKEPVEIVEYHESPQTTIEKSDFHTSSSRTEVIGGKVVKIETTKFRSPSPEKGPKEIAPADNKPKERPDDKRPKERPDDKRPKEPKSSTTSTKTISETRSSTAVDHTAVISETIDRKTTIIDDTKKDTRTTKKPEKPAEQCICEICTCGRHSCRHTAVNEGPLLPKDDQPSPNVSHTKEVFHPYKPDEVERPKIRRLHTQLELPDAPLDARTSYDEQFDRKQPVPKPERHKVEDNLRLEGEFDRPKPEVFKPAERSQIVKHPDNLKPEGDFERPKPEGYKPGERAPVVKRPDNLKPEGDFERPEPKGFRPGERAPIIKHPDNLKPEGDFERPRPDEYRPGDRAPIVKYPDNIKLEGDFDSPEKPWWAPAEKRKLIKPSDNLRPEGDFERPKPEAYKPGDRASIVKHPDNLRPEGDFDRPERTKVGPGERQKPYKPTDNLKPEGDFDRPKPEGFRPGERAPIVKHPDNLKPEGDFEKRKPDEFRPADRPKQKRPADNLKPEGDFERPKPEGYKPGERAPIVKHPDNLKPEGDFEKRKPDEFTPAERPKQNRPADNLRPEGDFERPSPEEYRPGERAPIVKHPDNLKPEGDFERRKPEEFKPVERPKPVKPTDNLKPEGDFERPKPSMVGKAERPKAVKPKDNLKPEGDFERPEKPEAPKQGERAPTKKPTDNLTTDGEFTGITTSQQEFTGELVERPRMIRRNTWTKIEGEMVTETTSKSEYVQHVTDRTQIIKRREDNLTTKGEMTFDTSSNTEFTDKTVVREKPIRRRTWTKQDGEIYFETTNKESFTDVTSMNVIQKQVRRTDNLKTEGTFEGVRKDDYQYITTERPKPTKPQDNLKPEGEFERRPRAKSPTKGERAPIVKPKDNLKPEGEFERRPREKSPTKGERAPIIRHKDNLKPEGEFEKRKPQEFTPADRPKQTKPRDNLKPEGEFERPEPEVYRPGERAPVVRHRDNLKPEGDFEKRQPQEYKPAERPKQKKPEDNLKPEGDFERRKPEEFRPGERASIIKHQDNLKPEGDFEQRTPQKFTPADRPKQKKPEDNLRPEGDFERPEKDTYRPGERAPVVRHADNLKPEGDFEKRRPQEFTPAERPKLKRPEDNLKPEGDFERPGREEYRPGERAPIVKHRDNLKPEGEFEKRQPEQFIPAERPKQRKPEDNLKPEGDFERPEKQEFRPGERAPVVKHRDNLKPEGEFEKRTPEKFTPAVRPKQRKPEDNLKPEGDFQRPEKEIYRPGDRAPVVKHEDNLRPEGDFEQRKPQEYRPAERAQPSKPVDNLRPEGEFERPEKERYRPAERPEIVKQRDNLKPEGEFEKRRPEEFKPGERPKQIRPSDNLRPEGDFERPAKEKYRPAERPEIVKHRDNLKPEGEFEKRRPEEFKPAERVKQKRPDDNLRPEGDFERPEREKYRPGERAPVVKHPDNLRPEGEFEKRHPEEFKLGERPKQIRPHDNLRPEGDFERPEKEKYRPAERPEIIKHRDNLKPEGEFEKRRPEEFKPAERVKPKRPDDNLRPEGDFERPEREQYRPGERAPVVKHPDNLKPEGEFERRRPDEFTPGDRPKQIRPHDNLRPEGDFERPEKEKYRPAERPEIVKHRDNLKPEGEFEKRRPEEFKPAERVKQKRPDDNLRPEGDFERPEREQYRPGERASVVRHPDNLKPEGEFEKRRPDEFKPAERVKQKRPDDNLRPEGDFERPEREQYKPGERASVVKHPDNLRPEGEFEKRHPEEFKLGERPKQIRPHDNLRPEGDFERPEKENYRPAERPEIIKHRDNLKPEGEFEKRRPEEFKPAERVKPKRPDDNLRPEGDFERPEREQYRPGERAPVVKHPDNLKPEGEFERRRLDEFTPGDRPKQIRPHDNLRPEGDFERPEKEKYRPAERPEIVKHRDNLKPEGEFEKRRPEEFKPAERVKQKRPDDNLRPEGDFERPEREQYRPGERASVVRHPDNLKPEGEFEKRRPEEFRPAERPKQKRPDDNLRPEGDFERPEREQYRPGERAPVVRHPDNLKPEGEFEKRRPDEFKPAERVKQKRPNDNLRPEGDFERPEREQYRPGERAPVVKHPDNLKPEGEFEKRRPDEFTPGDRPKQIRPHDNLKPEGDFERPEKERYRPAERPEIVKHRDNLKPEGEFEKRRPEEFKPAERVKQKRPDDNLRPEGDFERPEREQYRPGERASVVRHPDNLKPEGEFEKRRPEEFKPAERPKQKRPDDNLRPEGDFERPEREQYRPGERAPVVRHPDNLKPEGEFEKRRPDEFKPAERVKQKRPNDNLRPEGDFERPEREQYRQGERAPVVKHPDNLKPEGEFQKRRQEEFKPGDRPKQIRPNDNLRPEGDFERPEREQYRPGERASVVKHPDNLKPEGEFERRRPDEFKPAERPKQKRPEDNLKPEGEFERPEREQYRPGERAPVVKHPDNLKPEGEFEKRRPDEFKPAERVKQRRPDDNLRPEGDFERPEREQYRPGERAPVVKHPDNLKPEGEFEKRLPHEFRPAERPKQKRPEDNLKPEGDFAKRTSEEYRPGERAPIVKHRDNLKPEGEFEVPEKPKAPLKGERATIIRHEDNLKMEGEFEKRIINEYNVAERTEIVRHSDNLRQEGVIEMYRKNDYTATIGERAPTVKPKDNLKPEGEFTQKEVVPAPLKGDRAMKVIPRDNLKPEGDFTKRTVEEIVLRGERADVIIREDNLRMTGEHYNEKRDDYSHTKGERSEIVKHEDNLRMEGSIETYRSRDDYQQKRGERVEVVKREDNLHMEGEFIDMRSREEYTTVRGERAEVIIHEDNLRTEGSFDSSRTSDDYQYRITKRPSQVRPEDNLRPEGDFERPEKETYRPGDRAPIVKHPDNLRPEGEFEKKKPDEYRPAERPKQRRPEDNLKPEGEFERPEREGYRPGDRAPVVRHPDNLRPEGDFEKRRNDEYKPGERPKQKRPEDNLRPEGDFDRPEKEGYRPGDRAPVVKHPDNLRPEGEFEKRVPDEYRPGERPKQKRPQDNLRPEGDFERPEREGYRPGDRAPIVKHPDNLRPEGEFEKRKPCEYRPGERPQQKIPEDNLRPEGDFDRPEKEGYRPGDRADVVKHPDNLRPEGDFEKRKPHEYRPGERPKQKRPEDNLRPEGDFDRPEKAGYRPGERASVVKHPDNLRPEGDFEKRKPDEYKPGERPKQKRPEDNLRPEGDFENRPTQKFQPGERLPVVRHQDNLKPEGDFEKRESPKAPTNGERAVVRKPKDNLTVGEGEFERITTKQSEFTTVKGERTTPVKRYGSSLTVGEGKMDLTTTNSKSFTTQTRDDSSVAINRRRHIESRIVLGEDTTSSNEQRVVKQTQRRDSGQTQEQTISKGSQRNDIDRHENVKVAKETKTLDDGTVVYITKQTVTQTTKGATEQKGARSSISSSESRETTSVTSDDNRTTVRDEGRDGFVRTTVKYVQVPTQQVRYESNNVVSHHGDERRSNTQKSHAETSQRIVKTDQRSSAVSQHSEDQRVLSESTRLERSHAQQTSTNKTTQHSHQSRQEHLSSSLETSRSNQASNIKSCHHTSTELLNTLEGKPPLPENTSSRGHHRRSIITGSSTDLSNTVLHRKTAQSSEVSHNVSSTSAASIQRKSIQNLDGQFIGPVSQERKSLSSLHRQGLTQHEHATPIRRADNLSVGGQFYGQSEAKSYGNFTQTERVTRVRSSNASSFTLGNEQTRYQTASSYKNEFVPKVQGPCPVHLIENKQDKGKFKHTRDTTKHSYYISKV